MTPGTKLFRDMYISKDKLESYDKMCDIADERIAKVIFGVEKEVIFYENEIIDLELGFLNYMWNKLFLVSELYGVTLTMQEDKINDCYRVKILER